MWYVNKISLLAGLTIYIFVMFLTSKFMALTNLEEAIDNEVPVSNKVVTHCPLR